MEAYRKPSLQLFQWWQFLVSSLQKLPTSKVWGDLNTSCQGIQIHEIHETQYHHVFEYFGCDPTAGGIDQKYSKIISQPHLLRGGESQHHWHGAHFYLPWLGKDMIH